MISSYSRNKMLLKSTAMLLTLSILTPALAGCGGNPPAQQAPSGGGGGTMSSGGGGGMTANPPVKKGMGNGTKTVIVLAGAALAWYLWTHHKDNSGKDIKYYRAKDGRIYYRDDKHVAIFVTQKEVPASEAQEYSKYKGYDKSASGEESMPAIPQGN